MCAYLIEKILPLGETTVLFGDGGTGKGHLALAFALACQGRAILPAGLRATQQARVLYLDWESCEAEQQERLYLLCAGLGLSPTAIDYRVMTRALADDLATVRGEVHRRGIGFVIADSAGPAAGGEPESADSAIRLMTTLRALAPATRLLVAHVSKTSADSLGPARPYGSVFIQNLARSAWEVRRAREEDTDFGA